MPLLSPKRDRVKKCQRTQRSEQTNGHGSEARTRLPVIRNYPEMQVTSLGTTAGVWQSGSWHLASGIWHLRTYWCRLDKQNWTRAGLEQILHVIGAGWRGHLGWPWPILLLDGVQSNP